jgi:hypothetical protein
LPMRGNFVQFSVAIITLLCVCVLMTLTVKRYIDKLLSLDVTFY